MQRALILPLVLLGACAPAGASRSQGPAQPMTVRVESEMGGREMLVSPTRATAHSASVLLPIERAWAALPEAYAEVGLTRGTPNEAEHRLSVAPFELTRGLKGVRLSRYLDCGSTVSTANADAYAVTLQVASRLVPGATGVTNVETLVQATAKPIDTAGERLACTSTGMLERRIAQALQQRAR